jgi:hypothetical protein
MKIVGIVILVLLASVNAKEMLHPFGLERELMPNGKHLVHMHMQSAPVYGNSTDLFYYYTDMYVGDYENLAKQSLIVNTGGYFTALQCKGACEH